MLSDLPNELLLWIFKSLDKNDIVNLIACCQKTATIGATALFNCLQRDEMPPLHRAILNRRLDIARQLLDLYQANPNSEYRGMSTLLLAIEMSYPQAVNLMLEHHPRLSYICDFQGRGPLSIAVAKGTFAIVETLLQYPALDVNDRCTDGMSALMYAVEYSEHAILSHLLTDPRVNVSIEDRLGQNALHSAVRKEDHISVQILARDPRLDVNWCGTHRNTALLLAVKTLKGRSPRRVVEALLLNPRLDIKHQDSRGRTALWHAVDLQNEELVQLLLDQNDLHLNDAHDGGLTPLARAAERQSPRLLQMLLRQPKICINATSSLVSPLWAACRAGSLGAVQNLLTQRSIQINAKAPSGTSPLHVAVINQHLEIVSLLLSQGEIALNEVGPSGLTALMFAAARGYTACVERLLRHPQIDLQVQDPYGYCAFSLAILNRYARAVDLLSSAFVRQRAQKLGCPSS
ncbi:hypothetical protein N7478_010270 [Penicillium angulare]|uniref:uncharacterized protein n=1 Tax=Penicillium angulare TaxID=116970 RepID=UPI00254059C8|nr:uncharacterized protein N7478_010270 [Penicillium angulare]KAJ5267462.1 hypothetical protein N7478_010270 [Penicillium angulare]